jgi:hypothetical protein
MSKYSDVWMGSDDSVIDGSESGHAHYDARQEQERIAEEKEASSLEKIVGGVMGFAVLSGLVYGAYRLFEYAAN